MALFSFGGSDGRRCGARGFRRFLDGYSIEVMPRTAEKVEDFRALLPAGTRVYIAHIDGTPIDDMVATARAARGRGLPGDAALSRPASSPTRRRSPTGSHATRARPG